MPVEIRKTDRRARVTLPRSFANSTIIIDQLSAAPAYRLFVRRSAGHWLAEWLVDAAEEFRFTG